MRLFLFTNSLAKYESLYEYIIYMQPVEVEEGVESDRDLGWEILGTEENAEGCVLEVSGIYANMN